MKSSCVLTITSNSRRSTKKFSQPQIVCCCCKALWSQPSCACGSTRPRPMLPASVSTLNVFPHRVYLVKGDIKCTFFGKAAFPSWVNWFVCFSSATWVSGLMMSVIPGFNLLLSGLKPRGLRSSCSPAGQVQRCTVFSFCGSIIIPSSDMIRPTYRNS
jgi:hypothetical protein